jgi:hypothetical protein
MNCSTSRKYWSYCNSLTNYSEKYTLGKSGFLDFVHRLYFNKITTFRKLDLLPSSGKKGRTKILAVGPSGWASLRPSVRLAQPLLQIITHHRQNPLDFIGLIHSCLPITAVARIFKCLLHTLLQLWNWRHTGSLVDVEHTPGGDMGGPGVLPQKMFRTKLSY